MTPIVLTTQDDRRRRIATARPAVNSRQRTLAQLYVRKATLENLIQSLEVYERGLRMADGKVVALR